MQKMNLTKPKERSFIGLQNYSKILSSKDFWYAFSNSAFVLVLVVCLCIIGGFLLGFLLSKKTKLSAFLIAVAIIPWALPSIINGILWRFIFYSGNGLVNMILLKLNLLQEPYQWLGNRYIALSIIAGISVWRHLPFCGIVFLAAIQSIPKSTLEAARIDGADKREEIFHIVIPMTLSSFKVVFATSVLQAINVFDEIVALSGYRDLTKTLLIENYLTTFSFLDFGKGSALIYLIMAFSAWIGFLHISNLTKRREIN